MSRIDVNINPGILKWAREEAGFDLSEIADKVNIAVDVYKLWEKKGKNIPLGKLKTIASQYKRQLAVFFLPDIPEKIKKPKDYRNLEPTKSKLSKDVLIVMRDVSYFRQTALELQGETYWKIRYNWLNEIDKIKTDNNELSKWLREKLNISIEEQLSWKSDNEAYRHWRSAVENQLGILVFQFSMPLNEVQGFCFTESLPYSIVVNSKHSYHGRIFTIFHEIAHLVRHHSGICLIDNVNEKQQEEYSCNSFAGKFLIPNASLIPTEDLEEIQTYANKLRISREVYLRRLKEEKQIPHEKFFILLKKIQATYKPVNRKGGFRIKQEVLSRASRGDTFYNMVLDALNQNRISYTQASTMLDLKISKVLNEA
ncbi:MAG: ImmA/IrrE family metallo-endopeptidase [Sphingobacteriales bacterium]|nr:ImmA/IrrE family metallo-endopeptidase [Sphingobacteriales bacterium]MBI3717477.1 ImmA/IrrE family metallo-endopeptidase [Sphingobacteriales bacterium]